MSPATSAASTTASTPWMRRRSSWRRATGRRPRPRCSKKEGSPGWSHGRHDRVPWRVPIASVEQATGIARATLRIWERRYGFPQPGRDPRGERSYPGEQVRKLRLVANLMLQGHRPGRLVQLTLPRLAALAGPAGERGDGEPRPATSDDPVIAALRRHDAAEVMRLLAQGIRHHGLGGFVTEQLAHLNVDVGLAWSRGELEVFEEHLYSECVQHVVRGQLARVSEPAGRGPRVAARHLPRGGTRPGPAHGAGAAGAGGLPCTSLGVQVPLRQIVVASQGPARRRGGA